MSMTRTLLSHLSVIMICYKSGRLLFYQCQFLQLFHHHQHEEFCSCPLQLCHSEVRNRFLSDKQTSRHQLCWLQRLRFGDG